MERLAERLANGELEDEDEDEGDGEEERENADEEEEGAEELEPVSCTFPG